MVLAARRAPGPRPSLGMRARDAFVAAVFGAALSVAFGEPFPVDVARSPQLPLVGSTDGMRAYPNEWRPVRYGWRAWRVLWPSGILASVLQDAS